jgi:hypothetical protein
LRECIANPRSDFICRSLASFPSAFFAARLLICPENLKTQAAGIRMERAKPHNICLVNQKMEEYKGIRVP